MTAQYLFVTPHGRALFERRGVTTRPAQLAVALASIQVSTTILARTHPRATLLGVHRLRVAPRFLPALQSANTMHAVRLLEQPFPPGFGETFTIRRVARALNEEESLVVVVADPRAARALKAVRGFRVFDAYDAWDLSPLFAERPGVVREILDGYASAARHADLVLANTPFMVHRMAELGARRVELLPNGAPEPRQVASPIGGDVLYLGNIQRRLRMDLLAAAADAARQVGRRLRVVGTVQDEPNGWDAFLHRADVVFLGPLHGAAVREQLGKSLVGIVPHGVDDYTTSQDAMKTWEYLAAGLNVVSTAVPPAVNLAPPVAIADDPAQFETAVVRALSGVTEKERSLNIVTAANNTWRTRALRLREWTEHITQ